MTCDWPTSARAPATTAPPDYGTRIAAIGSADDLNSRLGVLLGKTLPQGIPPGIALVGASSGKNT